VRVYEGAFSFVRHREENSVGLLSSQWVGASLLFRLRPELSRDYLLNYPEGQIVRISGLSVLITIQEMMCYRCKNSKDIKLEYFATGYET
jgi:hypothetical protein